MDKKVPLVYACSGCSNSGHMAHFFANRLDRAKWAEMGCLAGVAGNVPEVMAQVNKALTQGRDIWVIDGCHFQCASACIKERQLDAAHKLVLTDYGHIKRKHTDVSPVEADRIFMEHVLPDLGLAETPES